MSTEITLPLFCHRQTSHQGRQTGGDCVLLAHYPTVQPVAPYIPPLQTLFTLSTPSSLALLRLPNSRSRFKRPLNRPRTLIKQHCREKKPNQKTVVSHHVYISWNGGKKKKKKQSNTHRWEQSPTARSCPRSRPSSTAPRAGCATRRAAAPPARTCRSRAPRRTGARRTRPPAPGAASLCRHRPCPPRAARRAARGDPR